MAEQGGGIIIPIYYDVSTGLNQAYSQSQRAIQQLSRLGANTAVKIGFQIDDKALNAAMEDLSFYLEAMASEDPLSPMFKEAEVEVKRLSTQVEILSRRLAGIGKSSIAEYGIKVRKISEEWNNMAAKVKFTDAGHTQLSNKAQSLLRAYKRITQQMKVNTVSLEQLARKEHEEAVLRVKDLNTIALAEEKIKILQNKIRNTPVTSPVFKQLKDDLKEAESSLRSMAGVNTGKKLAPTVALSATQMERFATAAKLSDSYVGRIVLRMAALTSVNAFLGMLRNVREITAEFELQKVALGALTQDSQQAAEIFERIKRTAVRSPFEVKDLVSYTKQLSAYRIETEKLFKTTMQLADISAGLGVEMDRLILAYGQVKAASVLRGQELRQFTEAGIPLVQKLADKFTELRGETVSTAEVFDLISKRAVSFEMVADIFDDMTSAGGEFYRMQELQAETLQGKWSNLKDAFSLMYDEMGRTQGAQAAMTGLINAAKYLADNWRVVGNVIKGVLISFAAYKIALKNEQIQTSALLKLDRRWGAMKRQLGLNVSYTTAELNKMNAAQLRMVAKEKLLIRQTYKWATANNILTASIAKARIMITRFFMSFGPWGWAIAAIGAIAGAFTALRKRAESAQEMIDKAMQNAAEYNNIVEKQVDLKKSLDTYDELISKTDRTEEETRKLKDTAEALAKIYPDMVRDTDSATGVLLLDMQALRSMTDAELEAMQASLQRDRKNLEEEAVRIRTEMRKFSVRVSDDGEKRLARWGKFILNLDKENAAYLEMYNNLEKVNEAIEAIKKALAQFEGSGPAETVDAAWRKYLKERTKTMEDKSVIKIFTADEIDGLESVNEAWGKMVKDYKSNREEIANNEKAIAALTEESQAAERKEIESSNTILEERNKLIYEALEHYGQLDLLLEKTSKKSASDARLTILKNELKLIEDINSDYEKLLNVLTEGKAKSKIENLFGDVTEINFLNEDDMKARLQTILDRAEAIKASFGNMTETEQEAVNAFIKELVKKIQDVDYNSALQAIQNRLKDLSREVSRTKEARSFWTDIFDSMGGKGIADAMTKAIFGTTGDDVQKALINQIAEVFSKVGDTRYLNAINEEGAIDFLFLEKMVSQLPKEYQKEAENIVNAGKKAQEELYKSWAKELNKEKSVVEKRVDIVRKSEQRIAEIRKSNLDTQTKDTLIKEYESNRAKQLQTSSWQIFKESAMYVQLFSDLQGASDDALTVMRERLVAMQSSLNNLDPTDLKEIQSRLKDIDDLLVSKNPFGSLISTYKKLHDMRKAGRTPSSDLAAAVKAQDEYAKAIGNAERAAVSAQQLWQRVEEEEAKYNYIAAQLQVERGKGENADSKVIENLEAELTLQGEVVEEYRVIAKSADETANSTRQVAENAGKAADAAQEQSNAWTVLKGKIKDAAKELQQYSDAFNSLTVGINSLNDAMGVNGEETEQLFGYISDGLNGANDIVTGIAEGGIAGYAKAIGGAMKVVASAINLATFNKINAANKSIEEQTDIVDKLAEAYSKLESKMEEAFGADYETMLRNQRANIQAQINATNAMIEAERSKGKKSDEDKIEEYESQLDELNTKMTDMAAALSQKMMETDVTSAAKDFASAWLDAYLTFSDTTEAMQEKLNDMIKNMVVNSLLAAAFKKILQPVFDLIDKKQETDTWEDTIAKVTAMTGSLVSDMDAVGNAIMSSLGTTVKGLRSTSGSLTGISKDIASASEESILGLAAGINTQNFYISGIYTTVNQILAMLAGSDAMAVLSKSGYRDTGMVDESNYLSYIPTLTQHAADILAECKQISADNKAMLSQCADIVSTVKDSGQASQQIVTELQKVIKPAGVKATYHVKTSL